MLGHCDVEVGTGTGQRKRRTRTAEGRGYAGHEKTRWREKGRETEEGKRTNAVAGEDLVKLLMGHLLDRIARKAEHRGIVSDRTNAINKEYCSSVGVARRENYAW